MLCEETRMTARELYGKGKLTRRGYYLRLCSEGLGIDESKVTPVYFSTWLVNELWRCEQECTTLYRLLRSK